MGYLIWQNFKQVNTFWKFKPPASPFSVELNTPAHGNTGKKPKHACSRDAIEAVLSFISNFAAIQGLPDPGRDLKAGKGKLTIYLPTIMNFITIHRIYRKIMEGSDGRVVEYHAFRWLRGRTRTMLFCTNQLPPFCYGFQ